MLDVAVIGGGVAGACAADGLRRARPEWSVGLFERSDRIGGRLWSVDMPGCQGLRAELGGMRFRTSQPLVSGLVEELGLAKRPFRTVHDDNRFFLLGERWTAAEAERSPAEVLVAAFEEVVPRAGELTDEEWLAVKRDFRWRGRPLRDWTLEEVLLGVLGPVWHRYVVDGFGYATVLAARNAADAIPWVLIEARPEEENHTLVEGMEALPRALAARAEAAGADVRLEHELEHVETEADGFVLRFSGREPERARRVVLALPAGPLARVAGHVVPPGLLGSVTGHAAAKLFLSYERPWWRDGGSEALRTVCDLPLSKTYYFDRLGEGAPLLLAAYSDGENREHWAALDDDERVSQAQALLRQLHPDDEVPEPIGSAFADWPDGAWHVWHAGVRSWEVMERIEQPVPDLPLFVCGEAFSWSQGWVEGALETTDRVLRRLVSPEGAWQLRGR